MEVYQRSYADNEVLVCMDETSKQQSKETRASLPTQPGEPERVDYEYERNGVSNLFMLFAPLEGWRHVKVTDRRTKATACSAAPEGRADWTLRLLADRLVECQIVESISAEGVRQILKKRT